MARPRKFDDDEVLRRTMSAFWRSGFAGTSMDELVASAAIGRQSLYNAFGDKRAVYLKALRLYTVDSVAAHIDRLEAPTSALEGIRELLRGLAVADEQERARGCFGVSAVTEFGGSDADVTAITTESNGRLALRLEHRVRDAQRAGELSVALDAAGATTFILQQMTALQVAARAGASVDALRAAADFAVDRLAS